MARLSRYLLYLLGLIAILTFFSPSFPDWPWSRILPWPWPLAAIGALLAFESWKRRNQWRLPTDFFQKTLGPILLILAVVLVTHLFLLAFPLDNINADAEALPRAGRVIVEEGARPIYFFNQYYGGALIAYAYAFLHLLGFEVHLAARLAHLLFFSLALFFGARLLRRITGDHFAFLFLGLSLWRTLVFICFDTTRGFSLVFFLLVFAIDSLHAILYSEKKNFFLLGTAAGLAAFQYQQALPLLAFILVAALVMAIRRRLFPKILGIVAGFILGAFPHLLAEVYNGFLNTRALFLQKSMTQPDPIRSLKNGIAHFLIHPKQIEPGWVSWILFSLFIVGFSLSLFIGIRRKKRGFLFLPAIYILMVVLSTLSGLPPDNARFQIHFRLYTPLALLIAAIPLGILFFRWPRLRIALLVLLLPWNALRFASLWRSQSPYDNLNRKVIQRLDRNPAEIVFGEYWAAKKYQACLDPGKIVLSSSSLLLPEFYRSPGQYLPDFLRACRDWNSAEKVYLGIKYNLPHLRRLLDFLGIQYQVDTSAAVALVYRIRPSPSVELVHLLSFVELRPDIVEKTIARFPRPWENFQGVQRDGDRLLFSLKPGETDPWPQYNWNLRLEREGFSINLPLAFANGRMEWTIPERVHVPDGEWQLTFSWRTIPLHTRKITLAASVVMSPPPLLRLDLADRQDLFMHLRKGKNIRYQEPESMLRFASYSPSNRLFHGVESEIRAAGAPQADECRIEVLDRRIERLRLFLVSPIDFDSIAWTRTYIQALNVRDEGNGKIQRFLLAPGFNEIEVTVSPGGTLRIQTDHASFFSSEDSAGNIRLWRTGWLLVKIKSLDSAGHTLGEIAPYLIRK